MNTIKEAHNTHKNGGCGEVLPPPPSPFRGQIGRTYKESLPDFPQAKIPPEGAPNVIVVLLDDVGFGQPSRFGGPIEMPTLDRLASRGLTFNRFHTTAMCSPTRAAMLTGRNHHVTSTGIIPEMATGYPGYTVTWPRETASIAEILRQHGYSTSAIGKWHNTPLREVSPFGPFDRWPTGLGFEYFYGFQGGDCDQWNPNLFENTIPVDPPSFPSDGYILDRDLASHAIDWIRGQRAVADGRPFFMWYAPGTAHAPHHAPSEWIDKYRGRFTHGWDKQREKTFSRQLELGIIPPGTQLTPRPKEIPSWNNLSTQEKQVAERLQEAFAGALSYCDHQIGRVLEAVEELGELDNTVVFYVAGDNGPSAEGNLYGQVNKFATMNGEPESVDEMIKRIDLIGTEHSYNNYPVGWAWAGSSPLKWFKQIASHFGGTRNGLVISWPGGIASDTVVREQFHHCIDVVPTILELCGIKEPSVVNGVSQKPIQGTSMAYAFRDASATSHRHTQYFELKGHRALYSNGWIASARHGRLPWEVVDACPGNPDDDKWELYNIDTDFSQASNLADSEPHRLRALQDLWWVEAGRNDVLPLDVRFVERYDPANRPGTATARERWHYPGRVARIPEELAPALKGRSHRITASITSESGRESGVIVSAGGRFGGYVLLLRDGIPAYVYNAYGNRYVIMGQREIPPGRCQITVDVVLDSEERGAAGTVEILVNGESQASGRVDKTVRRFYSYTETFDIGRDTGSPVDESYRRPYTFTGDIDEVLFELLDRGHSSPLSSGA